MLLIGRGAGKSSWASVEALVETLDVLQPKSDVGLYAASREQASIVFNPVADMVTAAPAQIKDRLNVNRTQKTITARQDGSQITVHTGEARREVGRKHSSAFIDELLAQRNEELYAAVKTGAGKRPNCRIITMTTPSLDTNPELFARLEVERAEEVAEDRASRPSLLPVIYRASKTDDPFDWDTVRKANPHLDCGRLDPQVIRDEMNDAMRIPSELAQYRVFRLCIWGEGGDPFIPLDAFDACAATEENKFPSLSELEGLPCGIGLDLSRTTDLTCISLMWWNPENDNLYQLWHHFASQATYERITGWTTGGLAKWVEDGLVKMDISGTDRIDHEVVQDAFFRYASRFNACLGVDRYDAYGLLAAAEKKGLDVTPLRQGTGLAHGIKMTEERIVDRGILHNGDPLVRWCYQNAEVRYTTEGWAHLVRPAARKSTKIIDPAVAGVMAADRIISLQKDYYRRLNYGAATTGRNADTPTITEISLAAEMVKANAIIDWDDMDDWESTVK